MPFQKNNQLGAKKFFKGKLDENPICFKGYEGQKEALKNVFNWQERLREFVNLLILEGEERNK